MDYPGFVGPSYTLQNISADAQRCVNMYPQPDESQAGKNRAYLLSTPGLRRIANVTETDSGGVRGTYTASNDHFFAVIGSTLFELSSTFAVLGSYPLPGETGTTPVSMTDNGQDMMIATGPNAYWFHFAANGAITTLSLGIPGTGWAAGDVFSIAGGTGGTGTVTAVTGGVPTAIALATPGTTYVAGSGIATTAQLPSTGIGLTVSITVTAANTLTQVTDAVFFGATTCGFIDGYIVFNQPNTQIFWITFLYSTVINPLGFASAEGSPDNLISLLVDHREIWLFGDVSTEVWYDSGNANFPFSFIQGAYISHGIVAPFSAARLDNTTFWLGNDEFGSGIVWRANGYAPVRISNFAMEQAIQRYPTITDAVAWTYQTDGHSFYVLNFPSGDATWVYDAATGLWHERAYLGTLTFNDGQLHRGRPITHSFAFGKHVVGDWETGYLYEMSPLFFDDDSREIVRLRRAPYIDNEKNRIFFSKFELDMEVGPPQTTDTGAQAGGQAVTDSEITGYNNATGEISIAISRPLGDTGLAAGWSNFQMAPGNTLPSDAVIQAIYPVIVGGNPVAGGFQAFNYAPSGSGLNAGAFYIPVPLPPLVAGPASGECYGNSIGTDLSLLAAQTMTIQCGSSIFADLNPALAVEVIACGYAIVYTSATPTINPQMPPPFAIPPGQGLQWAIPFMSSGLDSTWFGAGDAKPATPIVPPAWLNPGNILLNDGTFTENTAAVSGNLDVTDFGFDIPSNSSPTGFQAFLTGYATATVTLTAQLLVGGMPAGTPKTFVLPETLTTFTLGSLTDLWGTTPAASDVDATELGVRITVAGAGDTFLSFLSLDLGIQTGPPLINLRWSDDGCYTWSNYNTISMGASGQYRKRVIWWRLGNSRQRVFEVSTGQNYVGLSLYNAYLQLTASKS